MFLLSTHKSIFFPLNKTYEIYFILFQYSFTSSTVEHCRYMLTIVVWNVFIIRYMPKHQDWIQIFQYRGDTVPRKRLVVKFQNISTFV